MIKELSNGVLYKYIEQAQKLSKIFDVKYFFVLSKTCQNLKKEKSKLSFSFQISLKMCDTLFTLIKEKEKCYFSP